MLEDNFIIAKEMRDQLEDFGFGDVRSFSNSAAVIEFLSEETPSFTVLDVNLNDGATSTGVALMLCDLSVPFLFVTGYRDDAPVDPSLITTQRLTKPVITSELERQLVLLIGVHRVKTK